MAKASKKTELVLGVPPAPKKGFLSGLFAKKPEAELSMEEKTKQLANSLAAVVITGHLTFSGRS